MNWSEPVNFYCERASAAFWAEPVNALTNAGFLVAALAAFVEWRRAGGRDMPVLALIAVMALIGLGSFAFHTLATRGAVYLDVIPIAVFIYGYLALALRRFLALGWLPTIAILVGYIALSRLLVHLTPPGTLNGSIDYLPALAALADHAGVRARNRTTHGRFGGGRVRHLARVSHGRPGSLRHFSAGHTLHLAPAQRRGPVRAAAGSDPVRTESRMTYLH